MACFHPLKAFRLADGSVILDDSSIHDIVGEFTVPCGQCVGCRMERSRQWAIRCMHEARLHELNCFVTLTYDDEHLPHRGVLRYSDYQSFIRRLRKQFAPYLVRFFMCGEYGSQNWRPHYHALLFGIDFSDKVYWSSSADGKSALYRSSLLDRIWSHGDCYIGSVSFASAAYCSRYCLKKVVGSRHREHYLRVDEQGSYELPSEFCHMSLRPGIGHDFFFRFKDQLMNFDQVVMDGKAQKLPRYYDKLADRVNRSFVSAARAEREAEAWAGRADNTPGRLIAKEAVTKARVAMLHRSL